MDQKRKVAVMTWYNYRNYGTALQATAMSYTLKNMGYDVDFIKYTHKPITEVKNLSIEFLCKKAINKLKGKSSPTYSSEEYREKFSEFIKTYITETRLCNSYSELHDLYTQYDAFVCGSDQIWSPICYDPKYFLSFVEDERRMVAYAPSIGSTEIANHIIRERMAAHISRFQHLSVREKQGAELIKQLTGQDAKVVLDPTLLINATEWNAYIMEDQVQKILGQDYIVCYFLGSADKYMGYVHMLSKTMNLPYYVIPVTVNQKESNEAVPFEVGPREFISLIRNAKYVCTDSFHGMAFSVNYNIPFSVFKRFQDNDPRNQNSRIFNLLQTLGLEDRLVDYQNKREIQTTFDCDFIGANKKLNEIREYSLDYLKNALESAVSVEAKPQDDPFKITEMCCGCGACASICVKGAISIIRNGEGFEHYSVDQAKCVRCGQCKTVCPMAEVCAPDMKYSLGLYSVKSNSEQTLKKSSSGGVGHELASYLLDEGYMVCGCAYDTETSTAKHICILPDEKEKLSLLQGSKYVQSVTAESMKLIVNAAKESKIAFFGTPCQAAAVDKLLSKKGLRDNAVIIDLICHGVPSYHLWNKYLSQIDRKHGTGDHPAVLFRSKEKEWRQRLLLVDGNDKVYKKEEHKDDFYAFFRRGLCDMETCFDCPYRERSSADLRIGDYWGDKFIHDKQGVSMVIVNTPRGEELVKVLETRNACEIVRQDLSEYWTVQFPYNQPRPLIREQLITELKDENIDLSTLRKKYCTCYDQREFIAKVVYKVNKIIKR